MAGDNKERNQMTDHAIPDSLSILTSRGILELGRVRTITAADVDRVIALALRPCNAPEAFLTRLTWQIDGMAVDQAIGECGSRLAADVELLLVGVSVTKRG